MLMELFVVDCRLYVEVNINQYSALSASSYTNLTKFIKSQQAVNIQNNHRLNVSNVPTAGRIRDISPYPHY